MLWTTEKKHNAIYAVGNRKCLEDGPNRPTSATLFSWPFYNHYVLKINGRAFPLLENDSMHGSGALYIIGKDQYVAIAIVGKCMQGIDAAFEAWVAR